MDNVGVMLCRQLRSNYSAGFEVDEIAPPIPRRARLLHSSNAAFAVDRLLFRFGDYPRVVRRGAAGFDVFHVCDHSYSQLLHDLPGERTVVTCHDIETFRCLLPRERATRGWLFRRMAERILKGMQRAAHITCDSLATRSQLLRLGFSLTDTSVVPLGVDPVFTPGPAPSDSFDLLHVGSTAERKRIDVLLKAFALVRRAEPRARLLRAGGPLTAPQQDLAGRLGIQDAVVTLPFLTVAELADVYRSARAVLMPSSVEGFGFPVVEAMACGTPVIASNILVLREVGGEAALYVPVGDAEALANAALSILALDPDSRAALRARCVAQAAPFTWERFAASMVEIYRRLAGRAAG